MAGIVDAVKIDRDDAFPVCRLNFDAGSEAANAGVVEQDVDAAMARDGRLYQRFDFAGAGDIAFDRHR